MDQPKPPSFFDEPNVTSKVVLGSDDQVYVTDIPEGDRVWMAPEPGHPWRKCACFWTDRGLTIMHDRQCRFKTLKSHLLPRPERDTDPLLTVEVPPDPPPNPVKEPAPEPEPVEARINGIEEQLAFFNHMLTDARDRLEMLESKLDESR